MNSESYVWKNGNWEHRAIAEKALGKPLPATVSVHHVVDENRRNNRRSNLVICQDETYHRLLHVRARVIRAGGDPNAQRICSCCRQLKSFESFFRNLNGLADGRGRICRECARTKKPAPESTTPLMVHGHQMVTVNQVQTMFGASRRTVYNWMDSGQIRYAEGPSARRLIYCDSLVLETQPALNNYVANRGR